MQENTPALHPKRFSFDTAAMWSLAITGGLSAIALIPSASIPFLYTKVSLIAIGVLVTLACFILARLTRGNVILPPLTLIGLMWLVPLAYGLSTLFSGVNLQQAVFGAQLEQDTFGFVVLMAVLATLAALIFRRAGQYRTFFTMAGITLGIVLVAQVAFIALAKINPDLISATANLVGSFLDLGMLVGLGISLGLLALRFMDVSGIRKIALMAGMAVGLFVLALVNSVLVWVLVGLVALGLFIEAIMRRAVANDDTDLEGVETVETGLDYQSAADGRTLAAPLVVLVASLFFIIGGASLGNALVSAFGTNVIDVRPSWQSTFSIGSHTYASSPLFGSGPATFGEQWLKFRDRTLNDTIFWNVDFTSGIGYIPTSFVTTGVLGALSWIAFIGAFLFFGLRALLFRRMQDPFARFVSLATFTGVLYVLILSIFSVPGPIVLAAGFLLFGLFVSSLRYGDGRREWGIVFARNPRIGFVIVFGLTLLLLASVLTAYIVVERYLASVAFAEANNELAAGNLEAAEEAIGRSILFAPSDRAYKLAAASGIGYMQRIANDAELPAADAQTQFQNALSGSIEAALMATRLGPNNYQNWAALGTVYQTVVPLKIEGAYDNAKTAFQRAIELNPTNPALPYVVAQLEIAQGNGVAAEEQLSAAINLKNDYTQAIFLLSQLQVQLGKAREALQAAEAAAYFAPNDPTVLFQLGILRSGTGDQPGAVAALSRAVELNPQYANARFFLAVALALTGKYPEAAVQLESVAALSPENAEAVAADLAALRANRNPYPPSRLGALGIPQPGVTDATTPATTQPAATQPAAGQ
jgi:tetratricopeptide (TPR) repeat protein